MPGFSYRELARISFTQLGDRLDHKTVKDALAAERVPSSPRQLPLRDYHSHPDRVPARVQVIKLYTRAGTSVSISRFLHVSRPTVDRVDSRASRPSTLPGWWTRVGRPKRRRGRSGCR